VPLCQQLVYRAENADVRETYVGGVLVWKRGQPAPAQAREALRDLLPQLRLHS